MLIVIDMKVFFLFDMDMDFFFKPSVLNLVICVCELVKWEVTDFVADSGCSWSQLITSLSVGFDSCRDIRWIHDKNAYNSVNYNRTYIWRDLTN